MIIKMGKSHFRAITLVFFSLSVISVLSFQNCAGTVPEGETQQGSFSNQVRLAAPFAFDTSINRIAYNSCYKRSDATDAEQSMPTSTFFNYKVSAVDDPVRGTAGIKIRKEFLDYAATVIPPAIDEFGELRVPVSKAQSLLQNSFQSVNAKLQLGIHDIRTLNMPVVPTGANEDDAYQQTLPALSTDAMADFLLRNATETPANFLPPGSLMERNLALQMSGFSPPQPFRNDITPNARKLMLVLGYTGITDTETLEAPGPRIRAAIDYNSAASNTLAFARGYQFVFADPSRRVGLPPNIDPLQTNEYKALAQVVETDLSKEFEGRAAGGNWTCSANLRLRVYMLRDSTTAPAASGSSEKILYRTIGSNAFPQGEQRFHPSNTSVELQAYKCPRYEDMLSLANSNATYGNLLKDIRSVLPADQWYVHIPFNGNPYGGNSVPACAIPRSGHCYPNKVENVGAYSKVRDVMYRDDIACGAGTQDYCSDFISVCVRGSAPL